MKFVLVFFLMTSNPTPVTVPGFDSFSQCMIQLNNLRDEAQANGYTSFGKCLSQGNY